MRARIAAVGSLLKGIVSGKSVKTLDRAPQEGELGILKVSAVTWGEFRPAESKAMPMGYYPGACPRPMDQDILISRANTRELVGAPVMVRGDHPHLLLSDKILKLIPDEAVVDRHYLVRALRSPAAVKHFFQRAGGSSGSMTNITQTDIRDAEIFLPDLPEQRRIAAILDQADALRAKRREALAQLDRLTQAIFIDMFGDPIANAFNWPVFRLGDVVSKLGSGATPLGGEAAYVSSGIALIRSMNVHDGRFVASGLAYINSTQAYRLENVQVHDEDVLLNITGASVGRVCRAPRDILPARVNQHVMIIRPLPTIAPAFLEQLLLSSSMKSKLLKIGGAGATREAITKAEAADLPVICPPKELQSEFSNRVRTIEQLRARELDFMKQLDSIFVSLQHRAFRGEL